MNIFHKRQGQMYNEQAYFYTDTIHNFEHLLLDDNIKMIIINSLQYLVNNKLVEIYAYVIMPNHIHLIWNMLKLNGKESPAGSFAKFTAHQFQKYLITKNDTILEKFRVDKFDRKMQFWKRDPLAIHLSSEENLIQKLEYIHNNPIREKWNLASQPEDYKWSSSRFYKDGTDEFGILTHFKK
jgi:REP element-mobilizing transposase RayT